MSLSIQPILSLISKCDVHQSVRCIEVDWSLFFIIHCWVLSLLFCQQIGSHVSCRCHCCFHETYDVTFERFFPCTFPNFIQQVGRRVIYPVLACTGEVDVASLNINHDEVEEAFCVSLQHLCDPVNVGSTRFREGSGYTLPVYTGAAHRIWGLTAVIVHQVLNIIAPGLYNFKIKHKKSPYEESAFSKTVKTS